MISAGALFFIGDNGLALDPTEEFYMKTLTTNSSILLL